MPPPFPVGADLAARWTPSHESIPRWLRVKVIEVLAMIEGSTEQLYRVQTNMGVTMILPESDLSDFPANARSSTNPPETDFGEP